MAAPTRSLTTQYDLLAFLCGGVTAFTAGMAPAEQSAEPAAARIQHP